MRLLLTSLALSLLLVGALVPILRRAQFMDVPNHRSSHAMPVPRGGGLAVIAAIPASLLFARGFDAWLVVVVAIALATIGLVDDLRDLSSAMRLVAQVAGAGVVTLGLVLDADIETWWQAAVSCVVIVGFVNAFNFMDGVNGISALTTTVVGVYWAVVGAQEGHDSVQALGLVLAGAALGFLPWNAPRARVFLGDVGSYGLGLLIGSLSVVAWAGEIHWLMAVAPLAIYGADTGWVLIKRSLGGRPLTEAHREHVYQRLVDGGCSHLTAAALCAASVALVCVAANLTWRSAPAAGALVVVLVTLSYLAMPRLLLGTREAAS